MKNLPLKIQKKIKKPKRRASNYIFSTRKEENLRKKEESEIYFVPYLDKISAIQFKKVKKMHTKNIK